MTFNLFGLRLVPPTEYRLLRADAGAARDSYECAEEWKAEADRAEADYLNARAEIARSAQVAENNRTAASVLDAENQDLRAENSDLRAEFGRIRAIADSTSFARHYLGPDVDDATAAVLVDAALDAQSLTIRQLRAERAEVDTMHRQEVAALHDELDTVRGKHQRATALIGRLVRQRDRMVDGARLMWLNAQA